MILSEGSSWTKKISKLGGHRCPSSAPAHKPWVRSLRRCGRTQKKLVRCALRIGHRAYDVAELLHQHFRRRKIGFRSALKFGASRQSEGSSEGSSQGSKGGNRASRRRKKPIIKSKKIRKLTMRQNASRRWWHQLRGVTSKYKGKK
jgi:hypothetical protein